MRLAAIPFAIVVARIPRRRSWRCSRRRVINSKRPYPDGRVPERNDLWLVERQEQGEERAWGDARPLSGINTFALEESYATIDRAGRVVFVRGPMTEGGDDLDLFETQRQPDGTFAAPRRLSFSDERFGEGDPQFGPDGSYLIFTRWDQAGWRETCDLWIAFRSEDGWSTPVALTNVNTAGPDYAASVSWDGRWLFYRSGGLLRRAPSRQLTTLATGGTRGDNQSRAGGRRPNGGRGPGGHCEVGTVRRRHPGGAGRDRAVTNR